MNCPKCKTGMRVHTVDQLTLVTTTTAPNGDEIELPRHQWKPVRQATDWCVCLNEKCKHRELYDYTKVPRQYAKDRENNEPLLKERFQRLMQRMRK